jgi:hypothetical protein
MKYIYVAPSCIWSIGFTSPFAPKFNLLIAEFGQTRRQGIPKELWDPDLAILPKNSVDIEAEYRRIESRRDMTATRDRERVRGWFLVRGRIGCWAISARRGKLCRI